MRNHYFLLLLIFLFSHINIPIFAQTIETESQLALKYYQDKEYTKAAELYSKLFNQTRSKVYYSYYMKCLLSIGDFDTAEKITKKLITSNYTTLPYYVELGIIYKTSGNIVKANAEYETAIKKLPADPEIIINLANAFISYKEYDYAVKTYQKGKKLVGNIYPFNIELASVYYYMKQYELMITEYLTLLEISEDYIQSVQNQLQNTVYSDADSTLMPVLKNALLKQIQQKPTKTIYSELLIWIYIQNKDFKNAFTYAKALDKRNNQNGEQIITIGNLAASNEQYELALDCYNYVINKGNENPYYIKSKTLYLETLYKKITSSNYTPQDITEMVSSYEAALKDLGQSSSTLNLIINLAHIKGFYQKKGNEAIALLENTLKLPRLSNEQIARCKLELADVLLVNNNPWDAILYYGQVELANTENPIGHEAKFKKAKLYYYTGEFEYAKAQLDILKASTSKLIANDAFELAFLISNNSELDSIDAAFKIYVRGDFLMFCGNDSLALLTFDSLLTHYVGHSLSDEALYKKSEIYYKYAQYEKAIQSLETIITSYSWDILADDALFKLAQIYEEKYKNKSKAMELYKELIEKYTGSFYVAEARKRYRILRGDDIQ